MAILTWRAPPGCLKERESGRQACQYNLKVMSTLICTATGFAVFSRGRELPLLDCVDRVRSNLRSGRTDHLDGVNAALFVDRYCQHVTLPFSLAFLAASGVRGIGGATEVLDRECPGPIGKYMQVSNGAIAGSRWGCHGALCDSELDDCRYAVVFSPRELRAQPPHRATAAKEPTK